MTEQPPRFTDGASYDRMMGPWSRSAGEIFLDWISPAPALDWIDVGCGSGAFTQLVAERCAPRSILGIDPSEPQLQFARTRPLGGVARFEVGDAMALPLADATVDAAVAALVVYFMPDPAQGIAEMARVTRPGGLVATYAWDFSRGGFPYDALGVHMRALGFPPSEPVQPTAAEMEQLTALWVGAGLGEIETREIIVTRRFASFEEYWEIATTNPRMAEVLARMTPDQVAELRKRVRDALPVGPGGEIVPVARANAISGQKY
jgi:ubiquinone/menaquinone biosynthesis C-methylase UbiE